MKPIFHSLWMHILLASSGALFLALPVSGQNNFNQIANENIEELLPEVQSWNANEISNAQNNLDNVLGNFDDPENSDDVDFVDEDLGDQNQNIFGNDNNLNSGNPFENGNTNFAGDDNFGNDLGNDVGTNEPLDLNTGNGIDAIDGGTENNFVDLTNQNTNGLDATQGIDIQLPNDIVIDQNSPLFRGAKRPGTRRILGPGEAPFEYTIKPGDTLYDICDQLIDDKDFWPKLWAANPQIHNPHFIKPGMKLRFYPGVGSPSAIAEAHVKKYGSIASVPPEAYRDLDNAPTSVIKAPPPVEKPKTDHVFEPEDIITYIGRESFDGPRRLRVPSFVTKTFDKKFVYGKVAGGIEGQFMRSSRQLVLIKPSRDIKVGMSITFLRKGDLSFQTHKLGGRQVYNYIQHGEIVGKADGDNLFFARIDPGHGGVESGDLVVPFRDNYRMLDPKVQKEKRASLEDMYVIYFGSSMATQGGQGQFIYFDKGTSAGVKVGQQFEISSGYGRLAPPDAKKRYPRNKTYSSKSVWTPSIAIAEIIDVAPDSSVGFLLYTTREVQLGDRVSLPSEMNTSSKKTL